MIEFLQQAWTQAQQQSLLELVAVLLSVAYVVLAAHQNSWCWPCAFISTSIFVFLFWESTLVFNMLLNVFYIVMAVVGYFSWNKGKLLQTEKFIVKALSLDKLAILLCLGVAITVILVMIGSQLFQSEWIWLDAITTVFSIIATILTARKYIDNWYFWMVMNPLSAYLVYKNGLYLTSILMVVFTIMACYGYIKWKSDIPNEA
ncbi:nicotinamide mononucleotide transporter [Glaciecola sp. MH2013]|uniref:nicotinamide riboside transporter PnuC n=1 Tax=Glaciecola sp. MH2013 TaxID=2785524 RepID=UPI00189F9AF3|nr:nicotinamide riboside transporter PnuC [Glaciecola sp. MH2013]MBF7072450.1 nicotinamide mononucleotide transporter [Glaciecola sp. MH2013]